MDAAGIAKLITLLVLVGMFIAAVLVTPRIWHSNEPGERTAKGNEVKGASGGKQAG